MHLIDSHCHLDFPVFDEDRSTVIAQANDVGVAGFVLPGVTASRWEKQLQLSKTTPGCHAALGLHPCFMSEHIPEDIYRLSELLESEKVCAVGEVGLDLFIPGADLQQQLSILKSQLELAKQHDLPLILHVRKAHDQMLKELRQLKLVSGGVVHAFSGSEQQAEQYLKLGYKLGIGGTLTYDRARKLHRIVKNHPLESFVLETDSPDIPLANYRGMRNVPARVAEVAEVMAGLKGETLERVAEVTTLTAMKLFNFPEGTVHLQ